MQSTYRYGQIKEVFIYRFIVADSIQEKCYRLAVQKNLAACRIIDDEKYMRRFTDKQLSCLDDFEEFPLSSTEDIALNKILHCFSSVTSHDLLFKEPDQEVLTDAERSDADNQYKFIMSQQPMRCVDDIPMKWDEIEYRDAQGDSKLAPPYAPTFTSAWKRRGLSGITFNPVQPQDNEIDKYILHYQKCSKFDDDLQMLDGSETVMKSSTLYKQDWVWKPTNANWHRIRIKASSPAFGDVSEWSDWSAWFRMN